MTANIINFPKLPYSREEVLREVEEDCAQARLEADICADYIKNGPSDDPFLRAQQERIYYKLHDGFDAWVDEIMPGLLEEERKSHQSHKKRNP